jgi:ribosomal protein S18 acetylase RimI-like enzyme
VRESITIARARSWPSVRHQSGVLDLVKQVQYGEPYNYRPGESPPPEDWFPALVDRSEITQVAYGPTRHPVGYCVASALTRYPDILAVADELGVQPSTIAYLAELGVCARTRRRGIASMLLDHLLADPPAGTTVWVARTLEINTPAIALYQGYGFEFVPAAAHILHGRPRVYLVRVTQTADVRSRVHVPRHRSPAPPSEPAPGKNAPTRDN